MTEIPPSPHASSPNSTTSSSSSNSNGPSLPLKPPPLSSPTIPRTLDPNPYPTTFIQADTNSFKQVVQMLTGSSETASKQTALKPSMPKPTGPKKPAFKLYERRGSMKNLKMISPCTSPSFAPRSSSSNPNSPAFAFSPRNLPEILSPSILDLQTLALSPVTPLIADPFDAMKAEGGAAADKGFYFMPSPRTGVEPPRLLPLFPVSSSEV